MQRRLHPCPRGVQVPTDGGDSARFDRDDGTRYKRPALGREGWDWRAQWPVSSSGSLLRDRRSAGGPSGLPPQAYEAPYHRRAPPTKEQETKLAERQSRTV